MTITEISPITPEKPPYPLLQLKIMYWGPGEAGKTTNFLHLRKIFQPFLISKGFSIATTTKRTLWNDSVAFRFDLHSLHLSAIVQVATTTGQERFLATREYVLQNADGVIFVADSDPIKLADNKRSFEEVEAFTRDSGIPILIQLNKQDHPHAISELSFCKELGLPEVTSGDNMLQLVYPARADQGEGVQLIFMEMFERILRKRLL